MELAPHAPNVDLRDHADGQIVVLAFPYDARIVHVVRGIPGRRFDWDRREWWALVDDWVGVHVADVIERFPELTASEEVVAWLAAIERRWVGSVGAERYDGRGWWTLSSRAGTPPPELLEGSITRDDGVVLAPLTRAGAAVLADQDVVRLQAGARRCVDALLSGDDDPPPARLTAARTFDGERLRLDVLWDADCGRAFGKLPGGDERSRTLPIDPWIVEPLDAFIATWAVEVDGSGALVLDALRAEHAAAVSEIRRSRATTGEPIEEVAAVLGGELAPFQWAGVRYALDAQALLSRRRAGARQDRRGARDARGGGGLSGDRRLPRVAEAQLAARGRALASASQHRAARGARGRRRAARRHHDPQLRDRRRAPRGARARASRARSSSTSRITSRTRRPSARRRCGGSRPSVRPDGLRLALSGTPVMNHAEELVAQLRVIGRLEEFGSGAQFARQFRGDSSEERLHWHLRRRCFVRRLKSEVLPQLPAKRQVVVPVALSNTKEYRLAEEDVIAWLRSQPLDLRELNAKIAATLRAERLAQLGTLQRLAARGKLAAALTWIADFLRVRRAAGRVRAPRRGAGGADRALPRCGASARARLGGGAGGGGAGVSVARTARSCSSARRGSRARGSRSRARRTSRSSSSSGRRRCTTRPRTAAIASASTTRSPPGTCSPPTRSTRRWPR